MAGRLDDLSRTIGAIETKVEGLEERAADDRRIAEQRHAENQAAIGSVKVMVGDLRDTIETFGETVSVMQPQVKALQASRTKLTFYASIGIVVLAAGGFLVEAGIKAAVTWLLAKFGAG